MGTRSRGSWWLVGARRLEENVSRRMSRLASSPPTHRAEMSELVSRRNLLEKGLQENPIESWYHGQFRPDADAGKKTLWSKKNGVGGRVESFVIRQNEVNKWRENIWKLILIDFWKQRDLKCWAHRHLRTLPHSQNFNKLTIFNHAWILVLLSGRFTGMIRSKINALDSKLFLRCANPSGYFQFSVMNQFSHENPFAPLSRFQINWLWASFLFSVDFLLKKLLNFPQRSKLIDARGQRMVKNLKKKMKNIN